jgi:hypothetical protein
VPTYLNADQNTGGRWGILEIIKGNSDCLSSMVIYNETLLFQHNSEIKESIQWKLTHPPKLKKARISKSKIMTMFIGFFNVKGIIIVEYVPPSQIMNQKY